MAADTQVCVSAFDCVPKVKQNPKEYKKASLITDALFANGRLRIKKQKAKQKQEYETWVIYRVKLTDLLVITKSDRVDQKN